MSSQPRDNTIVFVIDTEQYSGNFERQMCAFFTGVTGDCGVGLEYARVFKIDHKQTPIIDAFANMVKQVPDDHECYRPCSVWETPGWVNDGKGNHSKQYMLRDGDYPANQSVAIYFEKRPTDTMIELMKIRANKFNEYHVGQHVRNEPVTITGFRLITVKIKREDIVENI